MDQISGMVKALDFIEANLKQEICVADIAAAVGYSLYHFCRTFNAFVQNTPYDYLMRRRLSEAACELRVTDRKIIDLAYDYQFNNPETFSRAFKRMFSIQPSQWKQTEQIDPRVFMPPLTGAHLEHFQHGRFSQPTMIEKPAIRLAGLMTRISAPPAVLADNVRTLWHTLTGELAAMTPKLQPAAYVGVTFYPRDWMKNGAFYLAALEIGEGEKEPAHLISKCLPARRYAGCSHPGTWRELFLTRDYLYATWLPRIGASSIQPFEMHAYGQDIQAAFVGEGQFKVYIPVE